MELRDAAESRVRKAFADMGIDRGGEFFVPWTVAESYIDACVGESLAIVGIEVFRSEGQGKLRPLLSHIADFSALFIGYSDWDVVVQATAVEARRFIEQLRSDKDVLLSFVLRSEQEGGDPQTSGS